MAVSSTPSKEFFIGFTNVSIGSNTLETKWDMLDIYSRGLENFGQIGFAMEWSMNRVCESIMETISVNLHDIWLSNRKAVITSLY